jgi:hypothetical protein
VERKSIVIRIIETWAPAISFSIACGVLFCMLAFLLRFTPLYRIAQILAWPGYLLNAIFPMDDTPPADGSGTGLGCGHRSDFAGLRYTFSHRMVFFSQGADTQV